MRRWIALLPLVALAGLGLLFATFGLHHDPQFIPNAMVGKPAPDESLPPLQGGAPQSLKAAMHGSALVNFFASWCVPCIQDMPALLALKAEGVRIVGVAYKDDPGKSRTFLDRYGDPFDAVLVDRDGRAGVDFGVDGVPDTFAISRGGVILAKHARPLEPGDAQALVERLTNERP